MGETRHRTHTQWPVRAAIALAARPAAPAQRRQTAAGNLHTCPECDPAATIPEHLQSWRRASARWPAALAAGRQGARPNSGRASQRGRSATPDKWARLHGLSQSEWHQSIGASSIAIGSFVSVHIYGVVHLEFYNIFAFFF